MSSPSMSGIPREVEWRGKAVRTAIWKEPVHGSVLANRLNLIGDGASRSFRSRWRAASYHGLSARFLPLLRELSSPIRISVTAVSARISQSNDLPTTRPVRGPVSDVRSFELAAPDGSRLPPPLQGQYIAVRLLPSLDSPLSFETIRSPSLATVAMYRQRFFMPCSNAAVGTNLSIKQLKPTRDTDQPP
jgi:hypothetical protein